MSTGFTKNIPYIKMLEDFRRNCQINFRRNFQKHLIPKALPTEFSAGLPRKFQNEWPVVLRRELHKTSQKEFKGIATDIPKVITTYIHFQKHYSSVS